MVKSQPAERTTGAAGDLRKVGSRRGPPVTGVRHTSLAAERNALGDTEGALDLLERAYRERDSRLAFLKTDARGNNLRAQPRFLALAQRMGLEAARAHGRY